MKSAILCAVICSLSVVTASSLSAASAEDSVTTAFEEVSAGATALSTGGQKTAASAKMSQVAVTTSEDQPTLTVVQDQSISTVYTAVAPGICLVVDDIVRQFCAANPNDISCQFQ